jgi:hypothetical protein
MRRWAPWIALLAAALVLVGYLLRNKGGVATAPVGTAPTADEPASTHHARTPPADPVEARRARDAMRAQILETLRKRGEPIRPDPPPRKAEARPPPKDEAQPTHGKYDPEYIRATFREDMFPLLKSCYEGALKRKPDLAGKLVLGFTIVGDHDVGGVIEDADVEDDSTLKDDEMETCVRESLMTLTFDKPPSGGGYVTVRYPIAFAPGDEPPPDDAGP